MTSLFHNKHFESRGEQAYNCIPCPLDYFRCTLAEESGTLFSIQTQSLYFVTPLEDS